jgi:hypothetical protein
MRKYELGEVVHIYNSSTQKAEAGGLGASLSYIVKPYLTKAKTKTNKREKEITSMDYIKIKF